MSRRQPIPVSCAEPINQPLGAEDVIAMALSIIRGRVFGARSTEVKLIRETLRKSGFEIVRRDA